MARSANISENLLGTDRYAYEYYINRKGHKNKEIIWLNLPNYEQDIAANRTQLGIPNCIYRKLGKLKLDEQIKLVCRHKTDNVDE